MHVGFELHSSESYTSLGNYFPLFKKEKKINYMAGHNNGERNWK
jgi:hypothetical protein